MDPTESHCSPKALCNEAIGARSIKVWQARAVSAAPALPEEQVGTRQIVMKWFAHIWILQS